jgi:FkbM family methyltransferase
VELVTALRKAALLVRLSRSKAIRVGDSTYRMKGFLVNALAAEAAEEPREPWLDAVYQALLRCREGAFLDVGANVGQTMLKILAFDKTRQYIGFEPQLSCSSLIQSFIGDNNLKGHTILPLGLSNCNRFVRLYLRGGGHDSTASMIQNFRPDSFYNSYQYVCVRKGDELIAELGLASISAIKIDVEGAELEVIEGLFNTIREWMPFIIFEVLNHYLVITGEKLDPQMIQFRESRIRKMECLLTRQGYEIYNVLPGKVLKRVQKIQPAVSADMSLTNYVAVSKLDGGSFLEAFPGTVENS